MENFEEHAFFQNAVSTIQELLDKNSENLDLASLEAVQHYLNHDEYEMAFEGLFLDLMKVGKVISDMDLSVYIELGKKLGLDQDSVFDADFWSKFIAFVERKQ